MKYSLLEIIKDLLAKIPVLENRINTLSTKASDLLSKMQGNEFVKSKNGENNIALKYEQKDGEDKKTLHAYVDGTEVPLGSQDSNIGTPDYSKTIGVYWRDTWAIHWFPGSVSNAVYATSTYIIPNDGWIVWTDKTAGDGHTSDVYPIHYFINGAQFYDTPFPVKKGDVITASNPVGPGAAMIFAPNR